MASDAGISWTSRASGRRISAGWARTRSCWPARLEEQPTDHPGVIGAEYDPASRRARRAPAGPAAAAGELSARMIAAAAAAC